ncbi:hypothetical protein GQX73_g8067 [Xylaria multiplex]|uniref:Uncharacterized protein n=1 Tax=Xylaria multiplex TaxID=323545 RepID=A0A7C8MTW6_9PEZI|nr:hypothetical protein GQX73_g8067 [Xylaria multiplex]
MDPTSKPETDQNVPSLGIENPPESEAADYQSDGLDSPFDPDTNNANTHMSNDELNKTLATRDCYTLFKSFNKIELLEDAKRREQLGSIPTTLCNEAIPLFEHGDNHYQLHFSYTWMKAIHTFTSIGESSPGTPDWYVHCLAAVTKQGHMDIVTWPLMIIPLGKLFVNTRGRSIWTGYEMFVSNKLGVWAIYVPNEHLTVPWDNDLFGTKKLALLWPSLSNLESATYKEAKIYIGLNMPYIYDPNPLVHRFCLLEISTGDILNVMKSPYRDIQPNIRLSSEQLNIRYMDLAGRQLLLLAKENADKPFIKLSAGGESMRDYNRDKYLSERSLLLRATVCNSRQIVDMILESDDVNAYASEKDFSDVSMLYLAHQFKMEALVKHMLKLINPNIPRLLGKNPFNIAIQRHGPELMKLLLEAGKVDVAQLESREILGDDVRERVSPMNGRGSKPGVALALEGLDLFANEELYMEWYDWWCYYEKREVNREE